MSEIQNFYANKCVLITGASGTVGKIVTEKLLRACPDLKLVYVLMRAKTGKSPKERVEEFLKSPVFATLEETNPKVLNKVVLVEGDVSEKELGMDSVTRSVVTNQVNVVLHLAANIKHNLPLVDSIETNYLGTKRILDLCLEMKKMDAFVHVSTFAAYYDLNELEEKADNYFIDVDNIKKTLALKSGTELKQLEAEIAGGPGRNYVFTKTAAETLVKGYADKFPVGVIRLPGVGACLLEPEPGFMDSRISVAAFVMSCASGMMPYFMDNGQNESHIVPADISANAILAIGWDVATDRPASPRYYNCVAKDPITVQQLFQFSRKSALKNPHKDILWYPGTICIPNPYLYMFYFIFFVILPAQFLDLVSMLQMKEPQLTYNLFMKHKRMSMFWLLKKRKFHRDNMVALHNKKSFKDQNLFPTGEEYFDWSSYFDAYNRSLKKHVLKVKDSDTAQCRAALRRAYWMNVFRLLYFPTLLLLIILMKIL